MKLTIDKEEYIITEIEINNDHCEHQCEILVSLTDGQTAEVLEINLNTIIDHLR